MTEEKIKEMKNRISMELQNPITQQDFEIICKHLAELEAENAELKAKIEKMKCCENCKYHSFWGDELKCNLDYDTEFECLKTKQSWVQAQCL